MRARRSWPSRFNWASTSRSRKHPEFSPARGCRTWLQLGLDLAVEETRNSSAAGEEWYKMLQLGLDLAVEETPKGLGFVAPFYSLQLGLDLAVEETRSTLSLAWSMKELQLGLDLAVEETMLPALLALTTEALQLGLDLAVEETGTLEYLRKVGAVASIGPRPRGRGNEGMQAHSSSSLPSLQLGLDLAVEETLPSSRSPKIPACPLQLGLDLAVEETGSEIGPTIPPDTASIGPRPRGRGNLARADVEDRLGRASIGPRPRGRGNGRDRH